MAERVESWALKRILCATDFSDNAAAALDAAVALGRPSNAKILAVHVAPLAPSPGARTACRTAAADRSTGGDLLDRLHRFAWPAEAAGLQTESILRHGEPDDEIVAEAHSANADLIVLGRHSRGLPDHWFLGSVAERVVRKTPCPVLVVKPYPRRRGQRPRRVICALDLGQTSAATLAHAAALARALAADLLVLHALAGPASGPGTAAHRLTLLAGASVPGGGVQQRVVAGTPQEAILGAGLEAGDDLVVLGSHGGGILDRQFVGSTTLHLLRKAECDVLVVPAQLSRTDERSRARSPRAPDTVPPRSVGRA